MNSVTDSTKLHRLDRLLPKLVSSCFDVFFKFPNFLLSHAHDVNIQVFYIANCTVKSANKQYRYLAVK